MALLVLAIGLGCDFDFVVIPFARLREDSQIDLATRNVYLHVPLRPPPSYLETFQSKIDNQFKMCAVADLDDTKNQV